MRFTVQHISLIFGCCFVLTGLNLMLGSDVSAPRFVYSLVLCVVGAALSLGRHHKKHPDIVVAPAFSILYGIAGVLLAAFVLGLVFGPRCLEICTRTRATLQTIDTGVIASSKIHQGETAFFRDTLHFSPARHWAYVGSHDFFSIACGMPRQRYPTLGMDRLELELLAHLQPVEKCHSLFMLEHPLDLQFAGVREMILWELRCRLGGNGGTRRGGTNAEIVRRWWDDFEPLLQPLEAQEGLVKACAEYKRAGRSADFDAWMQGCVEQKLTGAAARMGVTY